MKYFKCVISIFCIIFITIVVFLTVITNSAHAEIEESFDISYFVTEVSDKPEVVNIDQDKENIDVNSYDEDIENVEDSTSIEYDEVYIENEVSYEDQEISEPIYIDYEEPNFVEYTYSADSSDFQTSGVVYDEYGIRYTWYSQNVLPGGGLNDLNSNGRHVDENGYICDNEGYIAVASSDYEMGTIVDTPFGEAKVYDTGCPSGTIDVYTDF